MGISLIPNQPVVFEDYTDPCAYPNNAIYKQLVNAGDVTQFQVKLSPCPNAEQLIPDPTFSSDPTTGDWNIGPGYYFGNVLCLPGVVGNDYTEAKTSVISEIGIYSVTIVVLQGSAYFTLTGTDFAYTSPTFGVGTHTVTFFYYDDDATLRLYLSPESCVGSINMYKIPDPKVNILTSDGTWVHTFDGGDINQNTIENSEGSFTFVEDTMTFSLDWDSLDLADGCYRICLIDPCDSTNQQNSTNLIVGGDFASGAAWSISDTNSTLGIAAGKATYASTDETGFATLENISTELVQGICYDITFSVLNTVVNARVRVECGTFIGTWRTAFGTYTEQFTYDGVSPIVFYFESLDMGITTYAIEIDNAIAVVADECLACAYDSITFDLGSHECTHLVNACNNENGFGFVFNGSGFSPRIRLKSTIVRSSYKSERNYFEDSAGNKTVQYFKRRKVKEFRIDPVPEYVHDFLSTLMGYDHVWIATDEYFIEDDEYTVNYQSRNDVLANVTMLISIKEQLVENTNCGADDNLCVLSPQGYLLDPESSEFVLADPQGRCLNAPTE